MAYDTEHLDFKQSVSSRFSYVNLLITNLRIIMLNQHFHFTVFYRVVLINYHVCTNHDEKKLKYFVVAKICDNTLLIHAFLLKLQIMS